MPPVLLLAFLFMVWTCWAFAAVLEKAVDNQRRRVPAAQRGGVSIVPAVPLFPLAFWATALLIDVYADPWGSRLIIVSHLALGAIFLLVIARGLIYLILAGK